MNYSGEEHFVMMAAINFCERLIDPDDLGHAVSSEVRREASSILHGAGRIPAPAAKPAIERAYIAGPMSGLPGFNFEAFDYAAELLRTRGISAQNPAEYGRLYPGQSWQHYMRQAIKMLITCDSIYVSVRTIYRWIDKGRLPKPYELGDNTIGFKASEVETWKQGRPVRSKPSPRPGNNRPTAA